jgi:hypothetical protein
MSCKSALCFGLWLHRNATSAWSFPCVKDTRTQLVNILRIQKEEMISITPFIYVR